MNKRILFLSVVMASTALASPVLAQQRPDAGRIVQEDRDVPAAPEESSAPVLSVPEDSTAVKPGGVKVTLKSISITGNNFICSKHSGGACAGSAVKYSVA